MTERTILLQSTDGSSEEAPQRSQTRSSVRGRVGAINASAQAKPTFKLTTHTTRRLPEGYVRSHNPQAAKPGITLGQPPRPGYPRVLEG